jgi:DNA-3-methyladenine glycosylase I
VDPAPQSDALAAGPDGRPRCFWAVGGAPEYVEYHDTEWGRPVLTDDGLFERLTLEAFQSGLSWLTILRKRPAFRAAFADFSIDAVARFGKADRERLLADAGIVRNRLKVEAALANARAALLVIEEHGSLAAFFWRFRPQVHASPRVRDDWAGQSPESRALARELKRRGFRFVGPTTAYSTMQAAGIVNDHAAGCCVHGAVAAEQRKAAALLGAVLQDGERGAESPSSPTPPGPS